MSGSAPGLGRFLSERRVLLVTPAAVVFLVSLALAVVGAPTAPTVLSPDHFKAEIDLISRLRARRAWVENIREPALTQVAHRLSLHPNMRADRPAQVVFPLWLPSGSCFAATLLINSGRGDGVIFEVEVSAGSDAQIIVRRAVMPDEQSPSLWVAIPRRFCGRPIELRLRTRPGLTDNYDWAQYLGPRIVACEGP